MCFFDTGVSTEEDVSVSYFRTTVASIWYVHISNKMNVYQL